MFVGNVIIFILCAVIALFYIANRRLVVTKTKYFSHSLFFAMASSLLGMGADLALDHSTYIHALCFFLISIYFVFSFLSFAYACLYTVSRILVHTKQDHFLKQSNLVVLFLCSAYVMLLLLNIPTGILFTLNEGVLEKGIFFAYHVIANAAALLLVLICYLRTFKTVTRSMHLVLAQLLPLLLLGVIVSAFLHPTWASNLITVLFFLFVFLNFRRTFVGEHSLATLGDRESFIVDSDYSLRRAKPLQLLFVRLEKLDDLKARYGSSLYNEILFRLAKELTECIANAHAYRVSDNGFVISSICSKKQGAAHSSAAVRALMQKGIPIGELHVDLDYIIVEYNATANETSTSDLYEKAQAAADYARESGEDYISYFDTFAPRMQQRSHMDELLRFIDPEHGYGISLLPVKSAARMDQMLVHAGASLLGKDGVLIRSPELDAAAEQAGKRHALTYFVLEQSCRAIAENPSLSHVSILLDLPTTQLADGELLHRLNEITARYRVSHEKIVFAVSEEITLCKNDVVRAAIQTISAMEYGFHIKGFGESGSSIGVLSQLPIRCVWLADSLFSSVKNSAQGHLIHLLHEIGFAVGVEGVMSKEGAEDLWQLGADYLITDEIAPMTLDELSVLLSPKK